MTTGEIDNRFTYHAPNLEQASKYTTIREHARAFALLLNLACPESREKSLAFTAVEEAVMWANASIARNTGQDDACAPLNTEPLPMGKVNQHAR